MRLESATPDLSAVVNGLIAEDMADALRRHGADLTDETAVALCLMGEGFGSASIAALMDEARCIAGRRGPHILARRRPL